MRYLALSFLMFTMLVGCKTSDVATNSNLHKSEYTKQFESSRLYATPWKLVKLESTNQTIVIPAEEEATITFNKADKKVSGRCCNSFFGTFSIDGNQVVISNMGATKMFCQGTMGDAEHLLFSMLATPQYIKIDGANMVMKSDNGTLYFVANNLE